MKAVIVLVLLAVGVFANTPEPHMNCLPQVDFAFFDIRSLEAINGTDFISNGSSGSDKIYFSLCQPTNYTCSSTPTHGAYQVNDKPCFPLTSVDPTQAFFNFVNEKNRSEGLQIKLTGGYDNSFLTINVRCGRALQIGNFKRTSSKAFEINMMSPAGCPTIDIKPIYNYISGEAWILKVVMMIVGLLLTFLGRQLVKPALFILGFGAVTVLGTYFITSYFITATTPVWALWTLLGVCVLVGLLVGYLAVKLEAVGYFCCGLILGYAFGNFIMMSVLIHLNVPNPVTVKYIIMGVSGIIFGAAMVKFRDILLIVATSLFGSLMVARTFFMSVADLPTEVEILNLFQNGLPIPPVVWGYLALYVTLAGLGIFVQKSRKTPDWDAKGDLLILENPYSYYQRA